MKVNVYFTLPTLGLRLELVLTLAVYDLGSGGSKANVYLHEYPSITTSIIVRLLKIVTESSVHLSFVSVNIHENSTLLYELTSYHSAVPFY